MQLMKIALIAAALAAAAGSAVAQDSVDIKVIGHIVPAGCTPSVSDGAVFDYGTIPASEVVHGTDDYTILAQKDLSFVLTCDASTRVALRTFDARAGSAVVPVGKVLLGVPVASNTPVFGLGTAEGKKIGGYVSIIKEVTADDNTAVGYLHSADSGKTWVSRPNLDLGQASLPQHLVTVSSPGVKTPLAVKSFSGTISIQAVVNKASELNLAHVINLDGQATIQVVYL